MYFLFDLDKGIAFFIGNMVYSIKLNIKDVDEG